MAQTNKKKKTVRTHEGAKAKRISYELQLRRSVLACLLWENQFYEDGENIAERIRTLVPKVDADDVHKIAIEAREEMKLRHAPLLLIRECAKYHEHKRNLADVIHRVIQRPDEICELISIYWMENKNPISGQLKKGIAKAFTKFDEYQLAKWNKKGKDITLRDVMFLCHPKPKNKDQEETFARLANDELRTPDTWETALSTGGDKKEEFERLLKNNKMGALAIIRNLRNFEQSNVNKHLVKESIKKINTNRVLPYRFITAAKFAPDLEPELEEAMFKCLNQLPKFEGQTVALIDVSGSMRDTISIKSDSTRMDAACGIALMLREMCEDIRLYSFSLELKEVPLRRGFALRDAIIQSQDHMGTLLGSSVKAVYTEKRKEIRNSFTRSNAKPFVGQGLNPERLIVFTDEQSHDPVPDPSGRGYMINIASNKYGVGYGAWHHIDGWSENVLKYIYEYENEILTD